MHRIAMLLVLAACTVGGSIPGTSTPDASDGADASVTRTDATTPDGAVGVPRTLRLTFRTEPSAGAVYTPNNVLAVWITNQGGTFVKTIGRWADIRRQYLLAWNQAAGVNDVDAVSGATRFTHDDPVTITWNLTNRQNTVVPDGTYRIRLELADRNATATNQNNQGTFTFVKGTAPQTQTGLANGGFTDVTIQYTP
jgi:hypothetical protein